MMVAASVSTVTKVKPGKKPFSVLSCGDGGDNSIRGHYVSDGVAAYYAQETYQNPHEDRVRHVLAHCWDVWGLQHLIFRHKTSRDSAGIFWDLCAGSGEVTEAFLRHVCPNPQACRVAKRTKKTVQEKEEQVWNLPAHCHRIIATDPFTFRLYEKRFERSAYRVIEGEHHRERDGDGAKVRKFSCLPLSFQDIIHCGIEDAIAPKADKDDEDDLEVQVDEGQKIDSTPDHDYPEWSLSPASSLSNFIVDLAVCSYALHLADPRQELPMVAMTLARHVRFLLIITPHKRPQLLAEWGWQKVGEEVVARTRAVLYRSTELIDAHDDTELVATIAKARPGGGPP
ncbi:unnamed protein product [Amoebophrya sp. A25]|nr:unnamed protein product [Amoebophrya sp. A25]|eukprot:GSA25T00014045001.1